MLEWMIWNFRFWPENEMSIECKLGLKNNLKLSGSLFKLANEPEILHQQH
jgi:hypothetical protein